MKLFTIQSAIDAAIAFSVRWNGPAYVVSTGDGKYQVVSSVREQYVDATFFKGRAVKRGYSGYMRSA